MLGRGHIGDAAEANFHDTKQHERSAADEMTTGTHAIVAHNERMRALLIGCRIVECFVSERETERYQPLPHRTNGSPAVSVACRVQ